MQTESAGRRHGPAPGRHLRPRVLRAAGSACTAPWATARWPCSRLPDFTPGKPAASSASKSLRCLALHEGRAELAVGSSDCAHPHSGPRLAGL
ncbi:MAG: hypothetical protein WKG07_49710 [Hymenobacter sp.]